jgi:uracil-DNA glycosylase
MTQIVLVGESWGKEEEEAQAPFVGASGRLLSSLLHRVGINRHECFLTNVFNLRPQPSNDISNLCGSKAERIAGYPSVASGKYIHARYAPELERLYRELQREAPNLIIALGGTALWALTHKPGITKYRGTTHPSPFGKVLPTFHPAAVLRDPTQFPVVFADLTKARREAEFPEVRRPKREVWIEPTLADLWRFHDEHILQSPDLSTDIETMGEQITCIGFAPTPFISLVIPFYNHQSGGSYWPSLQDEMAAWEFVRHTLSLPKRGVGQNFLYDMHFLWRKYGIPCAHHVDDAMLLHHALQPELKKGLAFLGSIYTDEASWKFMRDSETGTNKLED